MIKKEQPAERKQLIIKMNRIYSMIVSRYFRGDYDKILKYVEQEEELIKHFQGDVPEEIKRLHTSWLWYRAHIYAYKGNLELSFKYANEILTFAQLYDHKKGISDGTLELGRYYWLSGDLDTALVHLDRAIRLQEENLINISDFMMLVNQLWIATRISIDKEDLERAKKYFKRLEEIWELSSPEDFRRNLLHATINCMYRYAKGCLLKSSMRVRDRAMAEDIFREIIEDGNSLVIFKLRALSELCELFLIELRLSNNIDIISEIKPLVEKLIDMAQQSGLYYWLIEAYILHGKLALIMFDIESSRRYLTQARRMAERHGYIGLADEIAGLHEAMMEKLDTWEQLEKIDAPLSERMELARLDDHLKGKFRTRIMKMERVTKEKITVYDGSHTCLICKGSAGGNVFICPHCKTIYCKTCARAVTDLENQCWTCNYPIDASKPVKPYKPKIEGGDAKESQKPKKY